VVRNPAVSSRTSYHSMGGNYRSRSLVGAVPGSGSSDKDSLPGKDFTFNKYKFEDLSVEELTFIDNLEKKAMYNDKAQSDSQLNESDRSDKTLLVETEHELTSPETGGIGQETCLDGGSGELSVSHGLTGMSGCNGLQNNIIPGNAREGIDSTNIPISGPDNQSLDDFPPGFSEKSDRVVIDSVPSVHSGGPLGTVGGNSPGLVSLSPGNQSLGSPMPSSYRDIVLAHLPVYKGHPTKKSSVSPFRGNRYRNVTIRKRRKGRLVRGCNEYDTYIPLSARLSDGSGDVDGRSSVNADFAVIDSVVTGALRELPHISGGK